MMVGFFLIVVSSIQCEDGSLKKGVDYKRLLGGYCSFRPAKALYLLFQPHLCVEK